MVNNYSANLRSKQAEISRSSFLVKPNVVNVIGFTFASHRFAKTSKLFRELHWFIVD